MHASILYLLLSIATTCEVAATSHPAFDDEAVKVPQGQIRLDKQAAVPKDPLYSLPPAPQPGDDEEMVFTIPHDYAATALAEKAALLATGEEAILLSEICSQVPKVEGEAESDYAQRYVDTMNAMIRQGVAILNDQGTADVSPSLFHTGGRYFELGPEGQVTKREYAAFTEWFYSLEDTAGEEQGLVQVPERFQRWEVSEDDGRKWDEEGRSYREYL